MTPAACPSNECQIRGQCTRPTACARPAPAEHDRNCTRGELTVAALLKQIGDRETAMSVLAIDLAGSRLELQRGLDELAKLRKQLTDQRDANQRHKVENAGHRETIARLRVVEGNHARAGIRQMNALSTIERMTRPGESIAQAQGEISRIARAGLGLAEMPADASLEVPEQVRVAIADRDLARARHGEALKELAATQAELLRERSDKLGAGLINAARRERDQVLVVLARIATTKASIEMVREAATAALKAYHPLPDDASAMLQTSLGAAAYDAYMAKLAAIMPPLASSNPPAAAGHDGNCWRVEGHHACAMSRVRYLEAMAASTHTKLENRTAARDVLETKLLVMSLDGTVPLESYQHLLEEHDRSQSKLEQATRMAERLTKTVADERTESARLRGQVEILQTQADAAARRNGDKLDREIDRADGLSDDLAKERLALGKMVSLLGRAGQELVNGARAMPTIRLVKEIVQLLGAGHGIVFRDGAPLPTAYAEEEQTAADQLAEFRAIVRNLGHELKVIAETATAAMKRGGIE